MPRAKLLRVKDPGETRTETFDFTLDLGIETIASADAVTATVYRGTDATPSALLNGASTFVSPFVYQSVIGGLANVDYKIRSRVVTSSGRKLVLTGILPVRDA